MSNQWPIMRRDDLFGVYCDLFSREAFHDVTAEVVHSGPGTRSLYVGMETVRPDILAVIEAETRRK